MSGLTSMRPGVATEVRERDLIAPLTWSSRQRKKLVKAVLVSIGIDPPRTHDIEEMVTRYCQHLPFHDRLSALADLTPYATGFRYPTPAEPPPLPSRSDLNARIVEIASLKSDFERWLATQGAGQL